MTGMTAGPTGGNLAPGAGRTVAHHGMAKAGKAPGTGSASPHGESGSTAADEHVFVHVLDGRPSNSRKAGKSAADSADDAAGGTDSPSNRTLPYDALLRAQLRADAAHGALSSPPDAQAGAEAHPPATGGRRTDHAAGAWWSTSGPRSGVADDITPREPGHSGADAAGRAQVPSQRRHAAIISRNTDGDPPGAGAQQAPPADQELDEPPDHGAARGVAHADATIPAAAMAPAAGGDPGLTHPVGSVAPAGRADAAPATPPPPASQQIASAILASARQASEENAAAGINRAFVVVLQPEQAGDVHIKLRLTRDRLSVTIAAPAREAHAVLQRDREVLGHLLADLAPGTSEPEITIVQAVPATPQPDLAGAQSGATGQDQPARHAPPHRATPPASDHEVESHDTFPVPVDRRSLGVYL